MSDGPSETRKLDLGNTATVTVVVVSVAAALEPWHAWLCRLALLGLALLLVPTLSAQATAPVLIEDWAAGIPGTTGIPAGWTGQPWGSPRYQFTLAADGGRQVLHLRSENESSTISLDLAGRVNLRATPILEWQWKVLHLPAGGDTRRRQTDDQAAQLYVVWPRFPRAVRSRVIGYVWDTTAPVGTRVWGTQLRTVRYIVVRSGPAELGRWITERRNVWDDYRALFGEDPEGMGALLLSIDSNDTRSRAEALIGPIFFCAP